MVEIELVLTPPLSKLVMTQDCFEQALMVEIELVLTPPLSKLVMTQDCFEQALMVEIELVLTPPLSKLVMTQAHSLQKASAEAGPESILRVLLLLDHLQSFHQLFRSLERMQFVKAMIQIRQVL